MKTQEKSPAQDSRYARSKAYQTQVVDDALDRLAGVNERLQHWELTETRDGDNLIDACRALCAYLHVDMKLPKVDVAVGRNTLMHEILYLSNVRYKDVSLTDGWWKRDNGAMLGTLRDGTPVALLPHRVRGYEMADPRSDEPVKVTAAVAETLCGRATVVYRTLPAEKIGVKETVRFLLDERVTKEIVIVLLCSLVAAILQVIPPIVSAQIFDVIVPESLRGILVESVLILLAFAVANVGFSVLMNLGISRIYAKLSFAFQAAIWDRLVSLPVSFFSRFTTGALLQKIRSIDEIKGILTVDNIKAFLSALFAFVNIIVLVNYSARITPYVLLLFVVAFAVYWVAGRHKAALKRRFQKLDGVASSLDRQFVRGAERVQASCAQARVFGIWSEYNAERLYLTNRMKSVDNALAAFQTFFQIASTAIVYLLVLWLGDMEMGGFVAYVATFLILQSALLKLLKVLSTLPDLVPAAQNIKPILDTLPEYNHDKTIPKDMQGTLEANQIIFRYGEFGRTILQDVSFRVEAGESLGIVGPSGSGKSTLLKVLLGFYPLAGGKVYYGGYDLDILDVRYLRQHIGVVMQNGEMTVGDIFGGITDNQPHLREEKVLWALDLVGMKEKVQGLPGGLRTLLHGCPLSDGEKQRLMMARAIVKEGPFLLLDEPTSHMDSETQAMIMQNLHRLPATKVIIAQRLSTVQHCDRILMLENGAVTHYGDYDTLLEKMKRSGDGNEEG